jgi:hypothetical protein
LDFGCGILIVGRKGDKGEGGDKGDEESYEFFAVKMN